MAHLSIRADGTSLERDGRPFPFIADTAWSAFADADLRDWRLYLQRRRQQGFTSVAVSILPILHDRTVRPLSRDPFATDADGHYDFDRPDNDYFATARRMVELARDEDITAALVVLWCNYVPGTWGAELTPWAVMDAEQRRSYITLATTTFSDLDPVYVISGDEHFHEREPTEVYGEALAQVKREAPPCLTPMHSPPEADLPAALADSPALDF